MKAKKFLTLLFSLAFLNLNMQAQSVTDSIHVAHYSISIDTVAYSQQTIRANTTLQIVSKMNNISTVSLDLLVMNIDSVFNTSGTLNYSYNDTTLVVQLSNPVSTGDTLEFTVAYNGHPQKDASGFGGFYFSPTMAFNMGVGFAAIPHNLGKVWFPCVDVFDDKGAYDFHIRTLSNHKAYCNGFLNDSIIHSDGTTTWHWIMNDPIPTYLACLVTGPYISWTRNYSGIPIEIAALPADTANVSATFINLPAAINTFVDYYGPYPFNKIGYSLVNFTAGAMEHATNISIGRAFINGTLGYETLWAHELSHMWWGDKVTCKTDADMWLNEGWASFNEALFTQALYGNTAYKNWIRTNHRKVLQFAHISDGSYLALNAIPSDYTYGATAYQKGADIVHTLRNYLGDSLFKVGTQHYLDSFAYGNASSADLRDALTSATGINMSRFFDDWIFTPGFPHFSIDSVVYFPGGLDHYFVYTRQRSKGNLHIYKMPVDITFSNGITDTTVTVVIDSATNMFHIPLIIANATWVSLDRNEKISDAITDFEITPTSTGNQNMSETNTSLNVQTLSSTPSTIRIEHNWVAPDGFKQSNPGIRLSDYHYWKVDGIINPGFLSKITFQYNGSLSTSSGYLDNTLITGTEDSLVLLYRASVANDWQIINANHNIGSAFDKIGSYTVDTMLIGEYALGYRDYTVSINNVSPKKNILSVQPNPAYDTCRINAELMKNEVGVLILLDVRGREIRKWKIDAKNSVVIDCTSLKNGEYVVQLLSQKKLLDTAKIIIHK